MTAGSGIRRISASFRLSQNYIWSSWEKEKQNFFAEAGSEVFRFMGSNSVVRRISPGGYPHMDKTVIGEVFFQNVKNSAGDFSRLFLCDDGSSAHQFEEREEGETWGGIYPF